ncbi:hypothetical protein [Asticcacaulis sp. YBE204]|uniref:hypothetical protein n=1 Tax=Asticcacaulis sp. YBE204 TaxID=1282363 RepID=UPI0003C40AA4|nr:hypothetical protein [Asticcacaulis sp. YBE204]ESQ78033.1 hypothetical protein AEYBE204_16180 [Asticcacaulis sp. YBE204]
MRKFSYRFAIGLVGLLLSVSVTASAAQEATGRYHYKSLPSPQELPTPTGPNMKKSGGEVSFTCDVTAEGRLQNCVVLTEDPAGAGEQIVKVYVRRTLVDMKKSQAAFEAGEKVKLRHQWTVD